MTSNHFCAVMNARPAASGAERTFSLRGTVEKGHHQAFALLKTSRACIPRHHRLWIGAALS